MGRIVRLTERDLTRLVRRVIREGEESSNITSTIQTAKQKYAAGDRNPSMEKQIKNCIKGNGLTSLVFLTTSTGLTILGILAIALATPGVNFLTAGGVAISGITMLIAAEMGLLSGDRLSKDVGELFECLF
jgi:hypothetical protein